MNLKSFAGGMLVAVFLIGALGQIGVSADRMSANDTLSIPAETVAGYVHAIIQADRATYTTQIVDRMQLRGITVASENWEQRGTRLRTQDSAIPLARLLREQSLVPAIRAAGTPRQTRKLTPCNSPAFSMSASRYNSRSICTSPAARTPARSTTSETSDCLAQK